MGRSREYASRTVASFSIEAALLQAFDEILDRDRTDRSEALQEMIARFVKLHKSTPNPQTTLGLPVFPNLWNEEELDLGGFKVEDLREMDDLLAPKLQALQKELARRSGVKRREGPPPGY